MSGKISPESSPRTRLTYAPLSSPSSAPKALRYPKKLPRLYSGIDFPTMSMNGIMPVAPTEA
ncbi:MAG: hypothetical protein AUJ96_22265 [Armatimonadetes bacterium CG2_30_66_41]|nr:MAG: hypothetical protein AUJ96_22265 [Armatimonadetes bacterium CG2_30_66_41]